MKGIRIHSCLYTNNKNLCTKDESQNRLTLTCHNPVRLYSSEDSDERVVIDQPLLDQKSFKRSVVHHSSCGEVVWIVHLLSDFRHLALNRFVTCPSSLTSSCLPSVSNLGLRLCGLISGTSRATFDTAPRCQWAFPDRRNRRKCVPSGSMLFLNKVTCFFAQHSFFNVEILHVELPLVESLHVTLQRCFVLILIIELVHLNDVLLDDVIFQ